MNQNNFNKNRKSFNLEPRHQWAGKAICAIPKYSDLEQPGTERTTERSVVSRAAPMVESVPFDTAAHIASFISLLKQATSLRETRCAFETYPLEFSLAAGITMSDNDAPPGVWIGNPAHATRYRGVYFHGGGYVAGSIRMYAGLVSRLAEATRSWIFLPDTPLAPEQQFPAAHDSAIAACRYAGSEALKAAGPAATLFLAGDSCGAALAIATAMRLRDEPKAIPLSAIVGLSPTLDMSATADSYDRCRQTDKIVSQELTKQCIAMYAPNADPRDPMLSPVYGRLSGLPPMLLQASEDEAVFDDSTQAASRARQEGAHIEVQTWPGLPHVWHLLAPLLPEATFAIQRIGEFVRRANGDEN